MSRRTWILLAAAAVAATAAVVFWIARGSGGSSSGGAGSGSGSGSTEVARPVPPPPPIRSSVPIEEPDIPADERGRAERAAALLDDAITRAERDLAAADAAGDQVKARDLTVELERLRAARALRSKQLGQ